jgi:chemotaxis protein methyltransferase CheR
LTLEPAEFQLFRDLIHHHTGIWLRDGKQVMLASRLSRRLRQLRMPTFGDYIATSSVARTEARSWGS